MPTVFSTLFELAIELQSDPSLSRLTRHHDPDRASVRARLQRAIRQGVMPDEAALTRWQRLRIFCRNHVNRAQPAVSDRVVKELLDKYPEEDVNRMLVTIRKHAHTQHPALPKNTEDLLENFKLYHE